MLLQVVGDDTTVMDSVLACDVERLELLKVHIPPPPPPPPRGGGLRS